MGDSEVGKRRQGHTIGENAIKAHPITPPASSIITPSEFVAYKPSINKTISSNEAVEIIRRLIAEPYSTFFLVRFIDGIEVSHNDPRF